MPGGVALFDTIGAPTAPVGGEPQWDSLSAPLFDVGGVPMFDVVPAALVATGGVPMFDTSGTPVRSGSFIRAKDLVATTPLGVFTATVVGLPSAGGRFGRYAYVTDAPGGPVYVFSDGVNWLRWNDRSVVA